MLKSMMLVSALLWSANLSAEDTLPTLTPAPEGIPYAKSYAVVVDSATQNDSEWKKVTEALVKKHNAALIVYDTDVRTTIPQLQKVFPKYVCFVRQPDNIRADFVAKAWEVTRKMDKDPYGDAVHAILTGYDAADAMRVINATEPREVETCLAQTSVGADRYKEATVISDGERDVIIHKTPDGAIDKQKDPGDKTPYFVKFFESKEPGVIITSSHGCQNTIEMPSGKGRIVSQNGKVWSGYNNSTINMATGQSSQKNINTKGLYPLKTPSKPNLFFAVGNCLVGEVNQRDCMVTSAFHSLNTTQFIGYTFTTWWGKMGHFALRAWEQGGGYVPINEAIFFGNQTLMNDLGNLAPEIQTIYFRKVSSNDNHNGLARVIQQRLKHELSRKDFHTVLGHMWDRDCVAFYGDPAFEIYLSKEHTFKPDITETLSTEGDEWVFEMTAHKDVNPNEYTAPRAIFFPERIESHELVAGENFKPVITDNFILVRQPGPAKKGEKMQVKFKVKRIGK